MKKNERKEIIESIGKIMEYTKELEHDINTMQNVIQSMATEILDTTSSVPPGSTRNSQIDSIIDTFYGRAGLCRDEILNNG